MDASYGEQFLTYICQYGEFAPIIIFFLFIASGFFLPISEELLFLSSGIIAGTCLHHSQSTMYLVALAGSITAAWQVFFIGRIFKHRWKNIRLFTLILTQEHLDTIHHWTKKWGFLLFVMVRFCPGGVRNAFFLSSGIGKTHFLYFAPRDALAAIFACSFFFYMGVFFSERGGEVLAYAESKEKIASIIVLGIIATFLLIFFVKRKKWFQ